MKRKDTQVYRKLINKYCVLRNNVERYFTERERLTNAINDLKELISKQTDIKVIQKLKNNLNVTEYCVEAIKYTFYDGKFEEMKRLETILINDYNDNVDIIYSTYKIF